MFAIRARRKVATERDFLDAVEKVVRQGTKFSSTCVSSPTSLLRLLFADFVSLPFFGNSLQQPSIPSVQLTRFHFHFGVSYAFLEQSYSL